MPLHEETVQQVPHTGSINMTLSIFGHSREHGSDRLLEPVDPALSCHTVIATSMHLKLPEKIRDPLTNWSTIPKKGCASSCVWEHHNGKVAEDDCVNERGHDLLKHLQTKAKERKLWNTNTP
jgi:hypothetical protein